MGSLKKGRTIRFKPVNIEILMSAFITALHWLHTLAETGAGLALILDPAKLNPALKKAEVS